MKSNEDIKIESITAEQKLLDAGYEGVIIFSGDSYDDALIGVSEDGRAIYMILMLW